MFDFISFKGRQVDTSKKVRVFRNLSPQYRKETVYSVVQGGRTVAHTRDIVLEQPTFHVSEKGRQYVLANKRKIVHAYVSGYINNTKQIEPLGDIVKYNPYKYSTFICESTSGDVIALAGASLARLDNTGVSVSEPRELIK
jgi:hypothetical protein